MKLTTIQVTVSRTVQIKQYHPSTISVTLTGNLEEGDKFVESRDKLYKAASSSVTKMMNQEIDKYTENE